ncbi:MAG: hypothetical protein JWP95_1465 [Actinotalea sp.]|nr:hypothetical protein [Actinotalea sp.]
MTSAVPAVPGTRPVPDDRSVRASTSPFAPRYRAVTWGMLTLIALTAFEALAVTTVMPAVVDSLGGLELYAMAFAAPVASGVVGLVAAGGWADRRGPARPLLTGVVLFVLGLAVAGTARVMEAVVAGRVVQGLGAGMLTVALYVIVARVLPDESQPRVLAAFAAAWVVPALVGPAVAGLVADHLDWRWVFLALPVLAVPAVLALRPAVALVAGPRPPEPGAPVVDTGPDWRRLACAVTAGTAALGLHVADQLAGALTAVVVVGVLVALAVAVPPLLPRGTLRLGRGLPSVVALRGRAAGPTSPCSGWGR